jgi:hypothetical protein
MLDRKVVLEDPITSHLGEKTDTLCVWVSTDRRVIMYPCNNNEVLNFALIHPDTESHATQSDGMLPSFLLT